MGVGHLHPQISPLPLYVRTHNRAALQSLHEFCEACHNLTICNGAIMNFPVSLGLEGSQV